MENFGHITHPNLTMNQIKTFSKQNSTFYHGCIILYNTSMILNSTFYIRKAYSFIEESVSIQNKLRARS